MCLMVLMALLHSVEISYYYYYFFLKIDLEFCLNDMDDCDKNANCEDMDGSFTCECKDGFQDMQPELPGRICSK